MGLNQFPELPDKFDPDLYSSSSPSSSPTTPSEEEEELESSSPPTRESHYLLHCLPTIPQIVTKLHLLRATHPTPLHRLYVLSNGWSWWLDELKQALKKDGWGEMVSSADVEKRLDEEQKWVGMAVDMAVAEKAEVFLGNGVRSLSVFPLCSILRKSNIILTFDIIALVLKSNFERCYAADGKRTKSVY